jgi:hypothetical protein
MKLSVFALHAGSAAAYTAPTMTFAVGKKAAPKKAATKKAAPKKAAAPTSGTIPSKALPYDLAPAALDGSLPGDVGFDPVFLTSKADLMADYYNNLSFLGNPGLSGIEWYREVELIHGRIAQMAVLGFIIPGFFRIGGLEDISSNPITAIGEIPNAGIPQILIFMSIMELLRIKRIKKLGSSYTPGDFGWGQGEGRYNPFNFNYTPEQYFEKQVQETKHGRLAMVAVLGLFLQAQNSGIGVIDQLAPAFDAPDYFAKAGYFFPEGI